MRAQLAGIVIVLSCLAIQTRAQGILFDFDGGPYNVSLPQSFTASELTATLTPSPYYPGTTDYGYAIWPHGTLGLAPAGMSGWCIYPSGVFRTDLVISFNFPINDFSILYAPQDLNTGGSATMRLTAFSGASQVATLTHQTTGLPDYFWDTGTLSYSNSVTAFDRVVIHHEAAPPGAGAEDWGPIFIVDNMRATPVPEPASLSIMLLGATALALRRRP